ncbi:MAG: trypsin-like peptidase domain-containing protein [Bacillota bacterium]|nr:trypsin-like peptidase domain-containing protein [Bacillota bacterium]
MDGEFEKRNTEPNFVMMDGPQEGERADGEAWEKEAFRPSAYESPAHGEEPPAYAGQASGYGGPAYEKETPVYAGQASAYGSPAYESRSEAPAYGGGSRISEPAQQAAPAYGEPAAQPAGEASMEFAPWPPEEKKSRKRGNGAGKTILTWLLVVVLAAGAGFGGGLIAGGVGEQGASGADATGVSYTIETESNINTAEVIAAKVIPSVVGVSTLTEVTYHSFFGSSTDLAEGVGTGIIVSEDGYIITNSHVISDGDADEITIQLTDGREMSGTVLWSDMSLDLAILKIDATGLTAAELGDSDEVRIGAYAVAIGNPLGLEFDRSVTQGVISGLNRSIQVSRDSYSGQTIQMDNMIQTDAAINSGNSGGPLLNSQGQVIGINTATSTSAENLGFAIPINTVKTILTEVMEEGSFTKAYIGIEGIDVAVYAQYFPDYVGENETGVYIMEITANSPAVQADLRVGDILYQLNDKELETMTDLQKELFNYAPGDTVTLHFVRNGQELQTEVVLGEMPEDIQ